MAETVEEWAARVRAGNARAISRAISAVEDREPGGEELLERLFPNTGRALLVGVTGSPGTGKSTLVSRLAGHYRAQGRSVGVLAVDPTSPFTGGAILGDRIRMQEQATDSGVFVRSMATRGTLGGLARATADAALVLDAAGKQIIFIETVGVGQDEVDIARLADCTLVLLVPGLGDDVQSLKAGLMEVADIFVLNKAEREGADRLAQQVEAALATAPGRDGWIPPVVRTTATEGTGIPELAEAVERFRAAASGGGRRSARNMARWRDRLQKMLEERLIEQALGGAEGEQALEALAAQVAERKLSPRAAVEALAAGRRAEITSGRTDDGETGRS